MELGGLCTLKYARKWKWTTNLRWKSGIMYLRNFPYHVLTTNYW